MTTQTIYKFEVTEDGVKGDLKALRSSLLKNFTPEYVDNGIGSYEFWGQRGVDHQYDVEVDEEGIAVELDCGKWWGVAPNLIDLFVSDDIDLGDKEYDSDDLEDIDKDDEGRLCRKGHAPCNRITATFRLTAKGIVVKNNIATFNVVWGAI